jgi:hypothetical protein
MVTTYFVCEHALGITSREDPGIAYQSEDAHKRCRQLFDTMKAAVLPTAGVHDELEVMTASTLTKIQYGSLEVLSKNFGNHDPNVNITVRVASV